MSSIIEGYNYDIFISYRQKDNKYDGWVTEFVENLKKELEATFKEEISVYFDINPHDGLLETHDVDASLKEKLKCLVFIPIISRTYCDPKSFAWEHEFKAFIELAAADQFGLKVRLPSGNVASRILPVKIHELEPGDKDLLENELRGFLRGIEFIYKEPGVNRPLKPEDEEKRNLGKTRYRNQINKAANAINEVISTLKLGPVTFSKEKHVQDTNVGKGKTKTISKRFLKPTWSKVISGVIILALLLIIILSNLNIFKHDKYKNLIDTQGRITVAVLPFRNLTNDTLLNVSAEIIQNELIAFLTNFRTEFSVRQVKTINTYFKSSGLTNNASITPSLAGDISQKLDANVYISGNIEKSGEKLRISAQLVDSKTKEPFKSVQVEGLYKKELDLKIIDTLRTRIKDFLVISVLEKEVLPSMRPKILTSSSEAYRYYILGIQAFTKVDYPSAVAFFRKALEKDSTFIEPMTGICDAYGNTGPPDSSSKWCLKAYARRNFATDLLKLELDYLYASSFGSADETIQLIQQMVDFDDQDPKNYFQLGWFYSISSRPEKAIPEFEKSLEITDRWGTKPIWVFSYAFLCGAYHQTGQYLKEKRLYLRAEKDFPDDQALLERQFILASTLNDTIEASKYLEKYRSVYLDKYRSIIKEPEALESSLNTTIAILYWCANLPDKAENYYNKALSLEPDSLKRIYILDNSLFGIFQNINTGIDYLSKGLVTPYWNFPYQRDKAVKLFEQGKYDEALDLFKKCLNMKPGPKDKQDLEALIQKAENARAGKD